MKFRASIKLCRTLVIVLLFNIVTPVVLAGNEVEDGQILLCTTAGLIKVDLADLFGESDELELTKSLSHGEHCPYCKLVDVPNGLQSNLLAYPAPDSVVALHYRSVLPTRAAQHIAKHTLLRAPPLNTLS